MQSHSIHIHGSLLLLLHSFLSPPMEGELAQHFGLCLKCPTVPAVLRCSTAALVFKMLKQDWWDNIRAHMWYNTCQHSMNIFSAKKNICGDLWASTLFNLGLQEKKLRDWYSWCSVVYCWQIILTFGIT